MRPPAPDVTVGVSDGRLVPLDRPGGGHGGEAAEDDAGFEERFLTGLAQRGRRRPQRVKLRLDLQSCLVRQLDIPRSARADAQRIADLDLERATPFRAGDVFTHLAGEPRPGSGPTLAFTHTLVKASVLAPVLDKIARSGGVVTATECVDRASGRVLPVDFLAPSNGLQSGRTRGQRFGSGLLMATAAGLGLAVLFVSAVRHEQALSGLQADTQAMRERLDKLSTADPQQSAEVAAAHALTRMKAERIPAVNVLEELSRTLPDTAWISELRLSRDRVDLAGYGRPAAALPPLLETSPLVAKAALTAPIITDGEAGKDRFSLRLTLRGPIAEAAATGEAGGGEGLDEQGPEPERPLDPADVERP